MSTQAQITQQSQLKFQDLKPSSVTTSVEVKLPSQSDNSAIAEFKKKLQDRIAKEEERIQIKTEKLNSIKEEKIAKLKKRADKKIQREMNLLAAYEQGFKDGQNTAAQIKK